MGSISLWLGQKPRLTIPDNDFWIKSACKVRHFERVTQILLQKNF